MAIAGLMMVVSIITLAVAFVMVRELWLKVQKLEQALLRAENPYAANAQMTVDRKPSPAPPAAKRVIGR